MAKQTLNVIVKDQAEGLAKPICPPPSPASQAASEGLPELHTCWGCPVRFPQAFGGGAGAEGNRTSFPGGPHCLWGAALCRSTLSSLFLLSSLLPSFLPPPSLPLSFFLFHSIHFYSFFHSFIRLLVCSPIFLFIRSSSCSFIHSLRGLFVLLFIYYLFNHLTSHPFIHVFSLQFVHHSFVHSVI